MDTEEQEYDVGVIVGRFQTPKLHESHKKLFDYVCSRHEKVVCYLGLSPIMGTIKNPLDFNQRAKMIEEDYPNVQCFYVKDQRSNERWVKTLDSMVCDMKLPLHKPLLYGSRDSFIATYKKAGGRFDTEELESDSFISATQVRKEASRSIIANYFVRLGMTLASQFRYPTAYCTVDVAIMDNNRTRILLGRKTDEMKFRFIGGFSEPNSASLEIDAMKETMEETHVELSYPEYICSMVVDDWRYRGEVDCIKTTLWIGDRVGGDPQADDDIEEVRWFDMSDFIWEDGYAPTLDELKNEVQIVKGHRPLMLKLVEYLSK
jgi:bifunctional NMN adenylyltransferase/nudix hydrolase